MAPSLPSQEYLQASPSPMSHTREEEEGGQLVEPLEQPGLKLLLYPVQGSREPEGSPASAQSLKGPAGRLNSAAPAMGPIAAPPCFSPLLTSGRS